MGPVRGHTRPTDCLAVGRGPESRRDNPATVRHNNGTVSSLCVTLVIAHLHPSLAAKHRTSFGQGHSTFLPFRVGGRVAHGAPAHGGSCEKEHGNTLSTGDRNRHGMYEHIYGREGVCKSYI